MAKGKYRAVSVKKIRATDLIKGIRGKRVVVAIDVAMEWMYAAIASPDRTIHAIIKWSHPHETRAFLKFVNELNQHAEINAAMEPSGTYGDALRYRLLKAGIRVWRVSPKRTHDAAEVYDGVPSLHDAKSAAIIAKLYFDGLSEPC